MLTVDFARPENLEASLRALGKNFVVTRGHWERENDCEARDLAWNHIDQAHREHIHQTYVDALRVFRSPSSAVSLTTVKLPVLGFPLLVVVNDMQLGEGLFYQTFTLFNLLHVHMINKITPRGSKSFEELDWYVVSHWLFGFLHPFLTRRFRNVMEHQSGEDVPIRLRRAQLREKGYAFDTDCPDILNSNQNKNGVIAPKLEGTHRFSLQGLQRGPLHKLSAGEITFVIKLEETGEVLAWPEVCPHQGGSLYEGKLCNAQIICPWHGLQFPVARLSPSKPTAQFAPYQFYLAANELSIQGV